MTVLNRILLVMGLVGGLALFGALTTPSPGLAMDAVTCFVFGCEEGCTSGENCKAHEKCDGGQCTPTAKFVNCEDEPL